MDNREIQVQTISIVNKINALQVVDNESYQILGSYMTTIAQLIKKVKETFSPNVKKAYEAYKEAKALENRFLKPLENIKLVQKQKGNEFLRLQELARIAAEKEAQKKAEAIAEKERKKLAAQLLKAQAKGNVTKTEALQEQIEMTSPVEVEVQNKVVAPKGITGRKVFKWKITDLNKIPPVYMVTSVNKTLVDGIVKQQGGNTNIPGIKVYFEYITTIRG